VKRLVLGMSVAVVCKMFSDVVTKFDAEMRTSSIGG